MAPDILKVKPPLMLADATLGRLCRWLRMIGIDIQLDTSSPDPLHLKSLSKKDNRWVLTRSRKVIHFLGDDRCLKVQSNDPLDQIRQVIRHFEIRRSDLHPLSRCIQCNRLLSYISRNEVSGQVPDHVWQTHDQFLTCSGCRKFYWSGSHASKIHGMIDLWFPLRVM